MRTLVSRGHCPHATRSIERPDTHGLFDAQRFDVVIVEQVIETPAMNPVLVVAEVLGVGSGIDLVEVAAASGSIANTRPDIADTILDVGLFNQQNCPRRIFHHAGLVTSGVPTGQAADTRILPVNTDTVPPRDTQARQRIGLIGG